MSPTRNSARMVAHPTVAIVCEVRLHREGLACTLAARTEFELGGVFDLDEVAPARFKSLDPDIVVLDVAPASRAKAILAIHAASPDARVIVVAVDDDRDALLHAEAGAAGYVSSSAGTDELATTIVRVARGEFPCTPRVAMLLARRVSALASARTPASHDGGSQLLTAREREILRLIDEGLSNKEIATRLGIGISTVKNHVHHILEKTRASRRTQAVARTRARGA